MKASPERGIGYILIDLDNTIYLASSGLLQEMDRRITEYVMKVLSIGLIEAGQRRVLYCRKHGTTLKGLLETGKVDDPEEYLRLVHPMDVEKYLPKDPVLVRNLTSIPLPLSILTNSPREHAERVLKHLEISGFFQRIFDLRYNRFQGKPIVSVYHRVLEAIEKKPHEVLFIDDHVEYLRPFQELGGEVLLVDEGREDEGQEENGVPSIQRLTQLADYLEERYGVALVSRQP